MSPIKDNIVKIIFSVSVGFLILAVVLTSVFFYLVNYRVRMPEVNIDYEQEFVYPDFIREGVVIGNNARELFFSRDLEALSYCYIGKMDGCVAFKNGDSVLNSGIEIVKKEGSDFYSYCQTVSSGKIPIVGDLNVNSAKKSYLYGNILYQTEIIDNDDFSDGMVNWDNAEPIEIENPDEDIENLKVVIPFLAREDTVKPSSDPNVYAVNGRKYIILDIDPTRFTVGELLAILGSKLSSRVMDIGKTIFNLSHASVDLCELNIKMVVEFSDNDDGISVITGRDCIMCGAIKLYSIGGLNVNISLNIDMSMSAVIRYEAIYYTI